MICTITPAAVEETISTLKVKKKKTFDTAISRKIVRKNVQATIPKGKMGYVQYTVLDTVAVELTFVAFL